MTEMKFRVMMRALHNSGITTDMSFANWDVCTDLVEAGMMQRRGPVFGDRNSYFFCITAKGLDAMTEYRLAQESK